MINFTLKKNHQKKIAEKLFQRAKLVVESCLEDPAIVQDLKDSPEPLGMMKLLMVYARSLQDLRISAPPDPELAAEVSKKVADLFLASIRKVKGLSGEEHGELPEGPAEKTESEEHSTSEAPGDMDIEDVLHPHDHKKRREEDMKLQKVRDNILDQMNKETDSVKRKQLEERLKSISTRIDALNRAAEGGYAQFWPKGDVPVAEDFMEELKDIIMGKEKVSAYLKTFFQKKAALVGVTDVDDSFLMNCREIESEIVGMNNYFLGLARQIANAVHRDPGNSAVIEKGMPFFNSKFKALFEAISGRLTALEENALSPGEAKKTVELAAKLNGTKDDILMQANEMLNAEYSVADDSGPGLNMFLKKKDSLKSLIQKKAAVDTTKEFKVGDKVRVVHTPGTWEDGVDAGGQTFSNADERLYQEKMAGQVGTIASDDGAEFGGYLVMFENPPIAPVQADLKYHPDGKHFTFYIDDLEDASGEKPVDPDRALAESMDEYYNPNRPAALKSLVQKKATFYGGFVKEQPVNLKELF